MRGDGVPVAPGMLDGEAVAAGVMKAEGAILGLFQETGLQDPQVVVHSENQWRHHGYHAYPGVDAQAASAAAVRGGLLIALRADVFAAEEVRDTVDIVRGKAMALDVVTQVAPSRSSTSTARAAAATPGRLRRPFGLTWPHTRRPRLLVAPRPCSSEGTSTCGWSPRGTPPPGGSKPCGNSVVSTGQARNGRRTGGPRGQGTDWTPSF